MPSTYMMRMAVLPMKRQGSKLLWGNRTPPIFDHIFPERAQRLLEAINCPLEFEDLLDAAPSILLKAPGHI